MAFRAEQNIAEQNIAEQNIAEQTQAVNGNSGDRNVSAVSVRRMTERCAC